MSNQNLALELASWLGRVSAKETPPNSVVAYNIGLFETTDGFSAYLIGADAFDQDNADWACEVSFTPEERYFPIPKSAAACDWKEVHDAVADAVRMYLSSGDGKKSFLASADAITVGFDDGDLERLV